MKSSAITVDQYLESLPTDRRAVIQAVREIILRNLPTGYVECMTYGMIGYVVPHSLYPAGYHCDPTLPLPLANLGSQKNHMALHLMSCYGDETIANWFRASWLATGKKLDMGKACIRFKKLEDLPLDLIGKVIARVSVKDYTARIDKFLGSRASAKATAKARASKLSSARASKVRTTTKSPSKNTLTKPKRTP